MKAQPSARSTGRLTIEFGMVSIPVSVYTGTDESAGKIKRTMRCNSNGNAVGYLTVDAESKVEVARVDTHKVFATDDGTEVELSDEEIAAAIGQANGRSEIVCFLAPEEASKYVPSDSYVQLRPQTVKSGSKVSRPFDKAFMLLMQGMAAEGKVALLKYTMRGTPKLGLLDSEGNLQSVRFDNEVRAPKEMPEVELGEEELAFASMLVKEFSVDEAPMIDNEAVKAVRQFAETKAAGGPTKVSDGDELVESADLMAQLKASVAAAKGAKKSSKSKKQTSKV